MTNWPHIEIRQKTQAILWAKYYHLDTATKFVTKTSIKSLKCSDLLLATLALWLTWRGLVQLRVQGW